MTSEDSLTLGGERVLLRRARKADVEALAGILAEPAVARWWGDHEAEGLRSELAEWPGSFVVELAGEVIGLVLVAEEEDPEYRHAGLDITLSTAHHGRGLGREVLRLVIDHLVEARGHHRFTIDPSADNEVAIRCYEAVGFRPVGIMRRYWRGSDGSWHDGLLMDLLAEELPR